MASNNRFFEDAARLAEGAMGSFVGLKREVETMVQAQLERLLAGMDLVRRDEFDAVSEMAANARAEQEKLEERVAKLEAILEKKAGKAKRKSSPPETDTPKD